MSRSDFFKIYYKSVVSLDNSIEEVSLAFIWLILSFTKLFKNFFQKKKKKFKMNYFLNEDKELIDY